MGLRLKAKTPSVMSLSGWSASMPTRKLCRKEIRLHKNSNNPARQKQHSDPRDDVGLEKMVRRHTKASRMPRRTTHRNRTGQMAGSRNRSYLYYRISSPLCPAFAGQRFGSTPSQATKRL